MYLCERLVLSGMKAEQCASIAVPDFLSVDARVIVEAA